MSKTKKAEETADVAKAKTPSAVHAAAWMGKTAQQAALMTGTFTEQEATAEGAEHVANKAKTKAPAAVKKEKKRRPTFTKTHSRRNSVLEIKESISKMNGGLCL